MTLQDSQSATDSLPSQQRGTNAQSQYLMNSAVGLKQSTGIWRGRQLPWLWKKTGLSSANRNLLLSPDTTSRRDVPEGCQTPWDVKHVSVPLLSVDSQSSYTAGTPGLISVGMGSRAKHRKHYCSGFPFSICDHSILPALSCVSKSTSPIPLCRDDAGNAPQP